jgi:threonine/homoserine/homoserine lactone efflux protein
LRASEHGGAACIAVDPRGLFVRGAVRRERVAVEGLAWLASATAFAVSMSATPGPNNAMVTASGATWGFRRTVPHMLGVAVGFPAMLVAVALGAGELLHERPWLHEALRWAGVAYLVWLAWKIGAAEPEPPDEPGLDQGSGSRSRPLSFVQAALFQWVNPKAWVIALGAVAAYTTAAGSGLVTQAAALASIFLLVTLPTVALWTLVGVGAARVLRTRRALRAFNLAMAALLLLSLAPMVLGG